MIMSCGSTNEAVQKPVIDEGLTKRQSVAGQPSKKPAVDPEQLAAQLGLSEEKTDEFVTMWNSTAESMRLVRKEHNGGDRKVLFAKMKEVKDERDEGLQTILTDAQLSHFYEIMAKNRSKIGPGLKRKKGN